MKYAYILQERERHTVALLCRVLGVSEQGYYQWRKRPANARKERDEMIRSKIRAVFEQKRQRYGSPRICEELKHQGMRCGRKRVARLMREDGLQAKGKRKFRATTDSSHSRPVAPNLLQRDFTALAPNTVWVTDITYLWTSQGWMYLAVFIDLYSRMVVGWALSSRMGTPLVTMALARAIARRRPGKELIVHSDRGVQYASEDFKRELARIGARQSMSRKADCWDNAVAESFFRSLKVEAIHGEYFETRRDIEYQVFDYIERFSNKERRHSTIGGVAPLDFERNEKNRQRLAA